LLDTAFPGEFCEWEFNVASGFWAIEENRRRATLWLMKKRMEIPYVIIKIQGIFLPGAWQGIWNTSRFPNADKLARFAGIAPVKFSSAGKGK